MGMFECRTFAPGETAESKTTYFYGRESKFEQAWDAVVVYLSIDSRWKDSPSVRKSVADIDDHIADKEFEPRSPFNFNFFETAQEVPVGFEIREVR